MAGGHGAEGGEVGRGSSEGSGRDALVGTCILLHLGSAGLQRVLPEVLGSLMDITWMAKPRVKSNPGPGGGAAHFLEKHLGRERGGWLEASA